MKQTGGYQESSSNFDSTITSFRRCAIAGLLILICVEISITQHVEVSSIQVLDRDGAVIKNPNAGGLRAPQFNKIDLNQDGIEDLLIFDRAGDVLVPMIAEALETLNYTFAPEYVSHFPTITEWMILEDYDNDGIKDLFCFPTQIALPGIEVWKGKLVDRHYEFELVKFPEDDFDILFIPVSNGSTQIYVSVVDIPVIEDIDGDGDLDILSFGPSGSTIFYYRNLAQEEFNDLSVLSFVLEDDCFGRFVESGFSQDVLLSVDGVGCANPMINGPVPTTRHAGSTVEVFDGNGDGLWDMLIGDIAYNGLNLLENGGTAENSWITNASLGFPQSDPVFMELFLTPKSIDVNNDGLEDLLVSTNDMTASQTVDHIWLYQNNSNQDFQGQLITKNFLTEDMIDLGESTSPSFTDYNEDGLIDLVIGTSGQFINTSEKEPSLQLFENIGTANVPRFQLVDEDYLDFNEFKTTSSFFAPSFGDLDGDGDDDLIVGDNRGFLYHAENIAGIGNPDNFGPIEYQYFDINVSGFARPFIFDVNEDGLGDLIIGERNFNSTDDVPIASLNYFQNIGSMGTPLFDDNINSIPNNAAFGRINLKEPGFINNNSAVALAHSNEDFVLVTGSEAGNLRLFSDIKGNISGLFSENRNSLDMIDVGMRSVPSLADIDNDGFLEVAVGNYRGGITLYETVLKSDISTSVDDRVAFGDLKIFPNPTSELVQIILPSQIEGNAKLCLLDQSGKKILNTTSSKIDVSHLAPGVYLILVTISDHRYTSKLIKV